MKLHKILATLLVLNLAAAPGWGIQLRSGSRNQRPKTAFQKPVRNWLHRLSSRLFEQKQPMVPAYGVPPSHHGIAPDLSSAWEQPPAMFLNGEPEVRMDFFQAAETLAEGAGNPLQFSRLIEGTIKRPGEELSVSVGFQPSLAPTPVRLSHEADPLSPVRVQKEARSGLVGFRSHAWLAAVLFAPYPKDLDARSILAAAVTLGIAATTIGIYRAVRKERGKTAKAFPILERWSPKHGEQEMRILISGVVGSRKNTPIWLKTSGDSRPVIGTISSVLTQHNLRLPDEEIFQKRWIARYLRLSSRHSPADIENILRDYAAEIPDRGTQPYFLVLEGAEKLNPQAKQKLLEQAQLLKNPHLIVIESGSPGVPIGDELDFILNHDPNGTGYLLGKIIQKAAGIALLIGLLLLGLFASR